MSGTKVARSVQFDASTHSKGEGVLGVGMLLTYAPRYRVACAHSTGTGVIGVPTQPSQEH